MKKKSYLLFGLVVVVVGVAVLATKMLVPGAGDMVRAGPEISEQLKAVDINIDVEGAGMAKLATADFLKMQPVVRRVERPQGETLDLIGFTLDEVLSYVGVNYFAQVRLVSAQGKETVATGGFLAALSAGKPLPPDKGPLWYVGGKDNEEAWLPNITKISVQTAGGMVFIPLGEKELETASELAGFKVATLTDLPPGYQKAQTYILAHGFGNTVTQIWVDEEKNTTITLDVYEAEPPEYHFQFPGEPAEINGTPAYKYVLDPKRELPENWADYWPSQDVIPSLMELRWPQGESLPSGCNFPRYS